MPMLLDLFCKAGGASMGYHRAGFTVVGVDHQPQRNYPFTFIKADAIGYVQNHGHEFDAIAASPPCQRHTKAQVIRGREHADLIPETREALSVTGKPWVIENVMGAPLINPIELCGCMFPELNVYRERIFESNVLLEAPAHQAHVQPLTKMGRAPIPGNRMFIVGNFIGAEEGRKAMGIDWMARSELSQAIPPPYTEYIGQQLMKVI